MPIPHLFDVSILRPLLHRHLTLILLLPVLLAGGPLRAASICGTVIDAASAEPVVRAGVFLRTVAGDYTGDCTATDDAGHYCLSGLFAGTYIIEVRVDDYVVCYRTGIEVADDITDVPIEARLPDLLLAPPWPNPSAATVKLHVVVRRSAPVRLSVYDAGGRLMRSWSVAELSSGGHDYAWDACGPDGRPVPSGLYFVQARSGSAIATRSLVVTR